MEKPKDIPQDVWDRAGTALGAPNVYVGRLSHYIVQERFARAILSAVEEERERCRSVANERAAQLFAVTQLPGSEEHKAQWAAQLVEALLIEQRVGSGHIAKESINVEGLHSAIRNRKGA